MNRRHSTAVRFIERVLSEHATACYPAMTEAAAQMAIELSYSQGDIEDRERDTYNERLRTMTARSNQMMMDKMRRLTA
jgi:tRNA U34 5-carboxymethylaminomethyl modifying GTPase MnmE/TrmE